MKTIIVILAMVVSASLAWGACIKSAPVKDAEYFEVELNSKFYHVPANKNGEFLASVSTLPIGVYSSSIAACNHDSEGAPQCSAPVQFLLRINRWGMYRFYNMTPEWGYWRYFTWPFSWYERISRYFWR